MCSQFMSVFTTDWCLRALSHGKFFSSVVPTASVAESVLLAQILKGILEAKVEIDAVATHVFTAAKPGVAHSCRGARYYRVC